MSDLRWEEPPPSSRGENQFDYAEMAEALRLRPKEWAAVRVAKTAHQATLIASTIRAAGRGRQPGEFEAVSRKVEGEYRVYARYVGGAP